MVRALIVCIGCTWLISWGHYFVGFVLVYTITICWFLVVKSGVISWLLVEKRKHFGNSVQQLNLELGANGEELFSDPAVHALFKYKHFRCNITGGLWWRTNTNQSVLVAPSVRSKVIEKKCKFASKQSQPTWKPQRTTQDAMIAKKGGKMSVLNFYEVFFILNSSNCLSIFNLDEVSFNSSFQFFLFSNSMIVFQFSISMKSLLILCFHLQQRREE